jgi:homoserine dehydrogenase
MMREYRLQLVGFGYVGRAFARLLERKREWLKREFDCDTLIVGIATGSHGIAINPRGLDWRKAIELLEKGQSIAPLSAVTPPVSAIEMIHTLPADFMFENSPVNHHSGQPALDHLTAALEAGMHAVTANKGPVVYGFTELTRLAAQKNRRFLFESAVMDGAPIFSLFRGPLPAVELRGFTGILNSCTNLLLELMEEGKSFDEALEFGRSIGITETDPSADIDGWDAAIKVAALSTVLMGIPLTPTLVDRTGIRGITPAMMAEAKAQGERWKLVCSAHRTESGLTARVAPGRVKPSSPLYSINGTSSFVQFETDVLPGLGILESNPGPETTAYGLLADMINALRNG